MPEPVIIPVEPISPAETLSPSPPEAETPRLVSSPPPSPPLSAWRKLGYGAGDLGGALSYTVTSVFLLFYLVEVIGLGPGLASLVLLSGRVFDAITDPLMGTISDRTRSRWGRRRPYILFGAIPFGLTFALVWMVPEGSEAWMFTIACTAMFVHTLVFTAVAVPHGALLPEIAEGYRERTSVMSYRIAFAIVASLVAFALPPGLAAGVNEASSLPVHDHFGWAVVGISLGLVMCAAWLAVYFSVRERFRSTAPPEKVKLSSEYRSAFRVHGYRELLLVFLIATTAVGIVSAVLPFYFQASARLSPMNQSVLLGLTFGLSALSLPLWTAISHRAGKPRALLYGLGIYAMGLLSLAIIRPDGVLSPSILLGCIVTGFGLGAVLMFPPAMLPDVVEFDELETGRRREGLLCSFFGFTQKLAYALGAFIVGQTLELVGYVRGADAQTPTALLGIHLVLGAVTALLLLMAAYHVRRYPITEESHRAALRALADRRG